MTKQSRICYNLAVETKQRKTTMTTEQFKKAAEELRQQNFKYIENWGKGLISIDELRELTHKNNLKVEKMAMTVVD